jgi:predicted  nucleic acid-binding Zn-ribbon protein
MEFQDYAAKETSALFSRLRASQTGATLQQLQAIREAIDAAAQAIEAAPEPDQEIDELIAGLTAAAYEEARRAGDETRRISQEARRAIDEAEAALQIQVDENARLTAAAAKTEAEAALLRSELETAQERAEAAERDFLATVDAHGELEAALKASDGETRHLARTKAHLENELAAAVQAKTHLELELTTAAQEKANLERELTTAAQAKAHLEHELSAVAEAKIHLEHELTTVAQARTHLESDLAATRATLEEAIADVDHLRQDVERQHAERAELERHVRAATALTDERNALAAELERIRSERTALQQQLSAAGQTAVERDALAREKNVVGEHARLLEVELESAHARITTLEDELSAAHGRDRAFQADIDAAWDRTRTLEGDLAAALSAVERHDAVVTELEMSRARTHTLEAERGVREDAMRQLQMRLDEALQAEARLREQAETKLREAAAKAGDSASDAEQSDALRWEVERMVSLFDASVRAVNEMSSARTSGDLMSELIKRLSLQFSRVALFRVKAQALEGELQVGFEDTDISKLVLPLTVDSLLTRAINSGSVESITGSDIAPRLGTPFNGTPTSAVALPILLQGTTVSVVYADDADMPDYARGPAVHESSVAFAKLLVGEATLLMMCHTHELKMLAELRQYATTLLQEAKEMYVADAEAGRPAAQVQGRLKDNIECASQLYAYRAAMEGTAAAALLDDQIAAEMSGTSPFARDLTVVVHSMAGTDLKITAEAS